MAETRYTLYKLVHYLAEDDTGATIVVTLQWWRSGNQAGGVYVRTHNGAEQIRQPYHGEMGRIRTEHSFSLAEQHHGADMLSQAAAEHEVQQRGGPAPRYCHVGVCAAQIPYAAGMCAEGHPHDQLPSNGSYVFGATRTAPITLTTGGKK